MKRLLKIVGVLLLIVVLAMAAAIGSAFVGNPGVEDGKELPGGGRVVKDGYTSAAVFPMGEHEVLLVDAGNDKAGKALLSELRRRGLGPNDVKVVLLTHGHPDHTAAIPLFPNARVMALAAEVPATEGKEPFKGPLPRMFGKLPPRIKVDRPLTDGETLQLGTQTVRVFAVPGHTQGSAAYLVSGVLCVGDSAGANTSGKLVPAPWAFSDDTAENHASLKALAARLAPERDQVKMLMTAHSGVLSGLKPLEDLVATF